MVHPPSTRGNSGTKESPARKRTATNPSTAGKPTASARKPARKRAAPSASSGLAAPASGNSGTSTGALIGAAVTGAAVAVAAHLGRKLAVQGMSARKGSWIDSLAEEHRLVLALFDKALSTDNDQVKLRKMVQMQIGHALDKHGYAEEHVVYPALRQANYKSDAAQLEAEHGEVKTYLYRLHNMETGTTDWLLTMRDFRNSVAAHAKLEEEVIFPRLRADIDEKLDAKITHDVNLAGFMMA